MRRIIPFFIVFAMILPSWSSHAVELLPFWRLSRLDGLAEISTNHDPNLHFLSFIVGDGDEVTGIYFQSQINTSRPPTSLHTTFTMAQIESRQGVVLHQQQGRNVLFLRGQVDPIRHQGRFEVIFLMNGITGRYGKCALNAAIDGNHQWHLYNAYTSQLVAKIFLQTWNYGITTIKNVCPQ